MTHSHPLEPAFSSPPSAAARSDASRTELVDRIRRGLGPGSSRRVGLHHAQLLQTMLEMENPAPDVRDIYRALLEAGRGMGTASLYRSLRLLEDAALVQRDGQHDGGRLRSIYRVVGRIAAPPAGAQGTCAVCGAAMAAGAQDVATAGQAPSGRS